MKKLLLALLITLTCTASAQADPKGEQNNWRGTPYSRFYCYAPFFFTEKWCSGKGWQKW